MDFQFEKPTAEDAPKTISKPWAVKLEYRSGKTPEAYADQATPEKAKAGFTFYRSETAEKGYLPPFKCALLGVYSGVSGAVPNGTRFDNYWSNFVKDTRTDTIRVQLGSGENSVTVAEGLYNSFKADLPTGVTYTKYAVVYIFETREVAALEISASFETALKESIGAEMNRKPEQVNLFNLFELSTRFWGFGFDGQFTERQKDGKPYEGKGDMFYYPVLTCGIVTAEKFHQLPELAAQAGAYIDAYQLRLKSGSPKAQPLHDPNATTARIVTTEQATTIIQTAGFVADQTFPTNDITSHNEVGGDDLPF